MQQFLEAHHKALKEANNIQRVRWDEKKILQQFATRSVNDIRADGTTHYGNICADITSIYKHAMQEQGYDSLLYLELAHSKLWVPEGILVAHLGLGFHPENNLEAPQEQLYYINPFTHNQLVLGRGTLPEDPRPEVQRIQITTLEGRLDPTKNLLDNYASSLQHVPFDIKKEARRLAQEDKNPARYKEYTKRINGNPHLYLEKRL